MLDNLQDAPNTGDSGNGLSGTETTTPGVTSAQQVGFSTLSGKAKVPVEKDEEALVKPKQQSTKTVLLSRGWAKQQKKQYDEGPNVANAKKHTMRKSRWKHSKHGALTADHQDHWFVHRPIGSKSIAGPFRMGKNRTGLIAYLEAIEKGLEPYDAIS